MGTISVFNVKDPPYNAKGDGSTNDTAAINQAIADAVAVGGTVYIPYSGSYYRVVKGGSGYALLIDGSCTIMGDVGATIKCDANLIDGTELLRVNSNPTGGPKSHIRIRDLMFDGNTLKVGTLLRLYNVTETEVSGCRFRGLSANAVGTFGYAIRVEGGVTTPSHPYNWSNSTQTNFAHDVRILGNHFEDFDPAAIDVGDCVFCYECDGVTIANNTAKAAGRLAMIFGPSRLVTVTGNESIDGLDNGIRCQFWVKTDPPPAADPTSVRDVAIIGNVLRNHPVDGIRLNGYRITCAGNVSSGNGNSGIRADACNQSTISANECNDNANKGIMLDKASGSGYGGHSYVQIVGNVCIGNSGDGVHVAGGGDTNTIPANAITIADNTCLQNGGNGMEIEDADAACRVIGNTCAQNGAAGGSGSGIFLRATILTWGGALVAFNRCSGLVTGNNATAKQPFGLRFDSASGKTMQKCYAYFNDFSDQPDTTAAFGAAINTAALLTSGATVNGQYLVGNLYRNCTRGVNSAATANTDLTTNDIIVEFDEDGSIFVAGMNSRQLDVKVTLTDAATISVDASKGNYFSVTLGSNRTMGAPSNLKIGQELTFEIIQDGTGGRTLNWNAVYKRSWSDAGNTANKRSTIKFRSYDGTNLVQVSAQGPYV